MMRQSARIFSLLLVLSVLLCGCGEESVSESNPASDDSSVVNVEESENNSDEVSNTVGKDSTEYFSDRDFEVGYDENESAVITLNGDSASCSSDAVQISGSTVTITDEGTYILSGTLDDGMIIVDSEKTDKTQLVLNGVTIHSETSAPIYILQSDKVFITTAAGTTNTLSNGGTFTAIDENNIDAVIFSKEDVTLNGSGTLVVTSPAGHGIVSKDSLTLTSGSYDINCASHALVGKDDVCVANAEFTIVSGKDGIHAENADDAAYGYVYIQSGTFDITAQGDGISAGAYMQIEDGTFTIDSVDDSIHSDTSVMINGGTFHIASEDDALHANDTLTVTNGSIQITESYEGLEGLNIVISGGEITLVASDDGINAAGGTDASGFGGRDGMGDRGAMGGHGMDSSSGGSILISGGTIDITAYGDGIDANGTVEITGGYVVVSGPTQGDTATLDYDSSATISGGTFIGTGASGMAQTFSSSQQGVISVSVGNSSAGSTITLLDSDGNTVITYTPDLSYQVFIFSSPDIISGETYTITIGSTSGEITAS